MALAMIVSPAHPLVLSVSHDLPAANPFHSAAHWMPPCLAKNPMPSYEQHGNIRVLVIQAGDKVHGAFAAMSASVSRSSNPRPPQLAALLTLPANPSASCEPVQNQ
jgi:hypothetical protein